MFVRNWNQNNVRRDRSEDKVLGEELFNKGQRSDYVQLLRTEITEEENESVRYHTRAGRPFGKEEFVKSIENKLKRPLARKPRGRPKKKFS